MRIFTVFTMLIIFLHIFRLKCVSLGPIVFVMLIIFLMFSNPNACLFVLVILTIFFSDFPTEMRVFRRTVFAMLIFFFISFNLNARLYCVCNVDDIFSLIFFSTELCVFTVFAK